MKQTSRIPTLAVAAVLVGMLSASLAIASEADAAQGPVASAAKKKHKKKHKKKKHKKRPAAAAPVSPLTPVQPAPDPEPDPDPDPDPDPGACAGEDSAEPDDSQSAATALPYPGSYFDVRQRFICPGDPDFFVVTVPVDGYFAVSAQPGAGLDLVLSVHGGAEATANANGAGGNEYLAINNIGGTAPVTAWIEVRGASGADTGSYELRGYET